MTVTVWAQTHSLLGAVLLGIGAGLWYDLLRALRWRIRSPALGIGLDLLFWLAVTTLIFGWSVPREAARCIYSPVLPRCWAG